MLPLYEAKMIHHYDTKWATYEPDGSTRDVTPHEKRDPDFHVMPRYWVHEKEMKKALPADFGGTGFFGYRNIARATDARTIIGTLIPVVPVGHSMPLVLSTSGRLLQAVLASFATDYVMRQKLGGTNLTYNYVQQLPMPAEGQVGGVRHWLEDIVDRLNSQRLAPETNAQLRAELDALMFHVYGIAREDVDYIMESFPIVKRKDLAAHGSYHTKDLVLAAYDRLTDAAS